VTPAGEPAGVPTCYRHRDRETYIRCQRCGKPICPDCMHDAAVGFQCPDCVHEGRRTTRQARTTYGGLRSGSVGLVSKVLIGINAAVWALIMATGAASSVWVTRLALIPRGQCGDGSGGWVPGVSDAAQCQLVGGIRNLELHWYAGVATGAPWQLVTSMFTHVQVFHIGFNMLALWFLGPQLELVLGRARFLALYLLSGLAGSAAVYWLSDQNTPTLGASGAIFGLMGALLVIAHKQRADVSQLLVWIGINAALTFFGSGISWQGHVGGFVGGVVLAYVLAYAPRERRTTYQAAGFAGVAILVVVAFVLRTASLG
jgi:membrane associated rhomboid family serine protease